MNSEWYSILYIALMYFNYKSIKKKKNNQYRIANFLVKNFAFIHWCGTLIISYIIFITYIDLYPELYSNNTAYVYFMVAIYTTIYEGVIELLLYIFCIIKKVSYKQTLMAIYNNGYTKRCRLTGLFIFIISLIIYIHQHYLL